MTNKKKNTSLVGVKWTKKSLLKCLEDMYKHYRKELDNNTTKMSEEELTKRFSHMTDQYLAIYIPIIRYGVTVKKK